MLLRALPALLLAATSLAYAEDTPAPAGRVHVIAAGETLADIALAEYGTRKQWKLILKANPGLDTGALKVGQQLVLPEITVTDPVAALQAEAAVAPDAMADATPDEQPVDELADRRDRHAALVDNHAQLDGGGIADQWKRTLAAAEDAQRAVPTDESTPHVRVVEAYATLLDRELELDELLDRMDVEAAVLDATAALKDQEDADGAKAKRVGALRGEMLAALARQHALQRDALVLRHHAAHVDAEADDKEAEAEKAGTTVEALRSQLDTFTAGEAEAEPNPAPAPVERSGF